MNKIYKFVIFVFLICIVFNFSSQSTQGGVLRESLTGELEFRAYYDRITGNEDLSFKTEGLNYLTDLYFYFQPSREQTDGIRYRGMLYLQGTDDPQYQTRGDNWRIQNIYLTATRPEEWEITGGYFSSRYTQYTMNSTLLGADGWFHPLENFRMKLFAGRQHRARSNEQYARYAGGMRGEFNQFKNHLLGINYIHTEDRTSSLAEGETSNIGDTVENSVYSMDYEGGFWDNMARLDGELAGSKGEKAADTEYDNELARRLRLRFRPQRSTQMSARYEKVDPDFTTVQGFASNDRRRHDFRFNQRLSKNWDFGAEYSTWEDIDSATRDVTNWRSFTAYRSEFDFIGEQEWSLSLESDEDEGQDEYEKTIWEVGLDNRFSQDHRLNLQYFSENEKLETAEEDIGIWRLDYSGNFKPYKMNSSYDLNTEYREDVDKKTNEIDRRWRVENDFSLERTKNDIFSLYYHYQEEMDANRADITRDSFGGNYKYILSRKRGNNIILSYEETETTDKEDPSRDYREQTVELQLRVIF